MAEPVSRSQFMAGLSPDSIFAVLVDFPRYPKVFREISQARVLSVTGLVHRVEFRAQIVLPIRYVLDLVCDPSTFEISWTFVEGEVVRNLSGGWRLQAQAGGTMVEYKTAVDVAAPLPGFVLRKILDGLVSLSIPAMLTALEKESRLQAAAG